MVEMIERSPLLCFVVVGCALSVPVIWRMRERIGVKAWWQAAGLSALFSISGVLGTQLLGKIEDDVFGIPGAYRIYGVFFFETLILLAAARALKIDKRGLFDVLGVVTPISLFFCRCGCLISGCCYGTVIGGTELRWPTREIELVFFVIMLLVLVRMEKTALPGRLFPLLMISYGCFRFVVEWFRAGGSIGDSGIHIAHIWSVVCFSIGYSIDYELRRQAEKKGAAAKERERW